MAIAIETEKSLQKWAKEAGLIEDGDHAHRLTIVMEVGKVTQVVVERHGDQKMMSTPAPDLSGVSVAVGEV